MNWNGYCSELFQFLSVYKTLVKNFKLSANPSVCNWLKIRHANITDGTFWKDEYEIEKTSFITLPALAITLSSLLDKHETYMSSVIKKMKSQYHDLYLCTRYYIFERTSLYLKSVGHLASFLSLLLQFAKLFKAYKSIYVLFWDEQQMYTINAWAFFYALHN